MNAPLRLVTDEPAPVAVVARAAGVRVDGLSGADVAARVVAAISSQRTDRALLDTLLHWGLR